MHKEMPKELHFAGLRQPRGKKEKEKRLTDALERRQERKKT